MNGYVYILKNAEYLLTSFNNITTKQNILIPPF